MAWIGKPLRRREDPALLTGQGRYSGDRGGDDTVHLVLRRAGMPSARIGSIDTAEARSMPGVLGVWTAGQLGLADEFMPDPPGITADPRQPVLVSDRVRYEGEAVAAVVALTEYQAMDAAQAIEVEIEPETLGEEAFASGELGFGDIEAAFAGAPVVVRERLRMGRILGAAMEPRAAHAQWFEAEGRVEVRASVGWAHGLRDTLASCLGLEPDRVLALAEDVGGSFGAKNHAYPEYVVAAALSRILKRPVRWVASRSEDGHTTAQAHAIDLNLELAAEADGTIRGFRCAFDWPVGGYLTAGGMQDRNMSLHAMSAYRLPALKVVTNKRYSHTPPAAFIRGGGRPVGNFAIERMIDRLARQVRLDPIEVRRRNLIPPAAMPYTTNFQTVVYDGGDYPQLLELAAERIGVDSIRSRQRAGERLGLGLAMCVESTGFGRPEPSRVVILADGTVRAFVGSTPQGQGHQTFVAQVTADRLGWPIDRIEVTAGDSSAVSFSQTTAGSRSAVEIGNSIALSAASARRRLLELASDRLEAATADIELSVAGAHVRGVPDRLVPLAELVGTGLEVGETWNSEGRSAFASSCHAALVSIDEESGAVELLRYVIAHDGGQPINPLIVDGQLHGGFAHGLGYALFEEATYGPDGFLLSPSFLDYTIVSAPELACEPELIHVQTPSVHNPEGFRGAGEAGTIAVPAAIANAVEDALLAAGRPALVDTVPITPERLWRLWAAEPKEQNS